jgi:hypothetical protein
MIIYGMLVRQLAFLTLALHVNMLQEDCKLMQSYTSITHVGSDT